MATTKKASEQTDWQEATNSQAAMVASFNGAMVQAFAHLTQGYVNGVNELTTEMTKFMSTRLRHDIKFAEHMSKCRDWSQVATLQQDWAKEANEEYIAEAQRLTEISQKLALNAPASFLQGDGASSGESRKTTKSTSSES